MPDNKWRTVRILVDSDINRKIENSNTSAFKTLEQMSLNEPKTKEEKVEKEFDKFVNFIEDLYPGNKRKLDMLKPIIFNKILKIWSMELTESYEELPDTYFEHLKGVLNSDN